MKLSDNITKNTRLKRKYTNTISRIKYIESLGYKVRIIWECEYKKLSRKDKVLSGIEHSKLPKFYQKHKGSVTETQI